MSLANQNDPHVNHYLAVVSNKGNSLQLEYNRPRLKDGDAFGKRFVCIFCKHLLLQPYQSTCGHRACQECLRRLHNKTKENGRSPVRCPECEESLPLDQFFPDRAATRELKLLSVSCPSRGCSWEGKYLDYFDSHQGACPHARVKCPFDPCNEFVLMSDVDEHMKICSYRQLECKYCGHSCRANQMDEHCKSCDQFPVQCPEGCEEEVPRELPLKAHIREDCVSHHRVCHYQPVGCKFEGCGKDMLEEKNTQFHLRMVWKQLQSINAHHHSSPAHHHTSPAHHIDTFIDYLHQRILQMSSQLAALSTEQQKSSAAEQSWALEVGKLQRSLKKLQEYFRERDIQAASYGPVCRMPDLARPSLETSDPMAIQTLGSRVGAVEDSFEKHQSVLQEQEKRGNATDRAINLLNTSSSEQNVIISQLQDRLQIVEDTSGYGPGYVWKITEVPRCRRDARRDPHHCIEIPPFYTSRHGYKLCLRVYLNGDGNGRGSHLSLSMTVMRGDYDALLSWPFRQTTTLSLMAQGGQDRALEDITQSFKPDESSTSFHRPQTEMNVASGCPQFCPLSVLDNPGYVKDEVLFIKCEISGCMHRFSKLFARIFKFLFTGCLMFLLLLMFLLM